MTYSNVTVKPKNSVRNYLIIAVVIIFVVMLGYALTKKNTDSEKPITENKFNLKTLLYVVIGGLVIFIIYLFNKIHNMSMTSPREEIGRNKIAEFFKEKMLDSCNIPIIYKNNKPEPQYPYYFQVRDEKTLSSETGEIFYTFILKMMAGNRKGQWLVAIPKDRGMKYIEDNLYDMMTKDKDYDNFDMYEDASPLRSNTMTYNRQLISRLESLKSEYGEEQVKQWYEQYRAEENNVPIKEKESKKPQDQTNYEYNRSMDNYDDGKEEDVDIKEKVREFTRRKNAETV